MGSRSFFEPIIGRIIFICKKAFLRSEDYLIMTKCLHSLSDLAVYTKNFTEDQTRQLCNAMKYVEYSKGDYVFHKGDPSDAFYIILKGEVNAVNHVRGEDVLINTLGLGRSFGERGLIKKLNRSLSIR
jgi:CRP-like cAMP-binding protein